MNFLIWQFYAISPSKSDRLLARIFHQLACKIGQAIVCTAYFLIERNTRVYFRLRKIRCANNRLARARSTGEIFGLVVGFYNYRFQGEAKRSAGLDAGKNRVF
jgi:hypothetical protein